MKSGLYVNIRHTHSAILFQTKIHYFVYMHMVHGFYICIIINCVFARWKNSYFSTQFCSSANLHNTLVEKLETLYFSESQFKYFRSECKDRNQTLH